MHASPITAAQALQLQGHMQPPSILHAFGIPLHSLDFRSCALGPKNTMIVGGRDSLCCMHQGHDEKSDTTKTNTDITSLTWRCCNARCYVQEARQEALSLATLQTREEGVPLPRAICYLCWGASDSPG
jgi:hypothetical protein